MMSINKKDLKVELNLVRFDIDEYQFIHSL